MNIDKDRQVKIQVAEINARAKLMDSELDLQKAMKDVSIKERQLTQKDRDQMEKARSNQAKEQLIRQDQALKGRKEATDRQDKRIKDSTDAALKQEDLRLKEKSIDKPKPTSDGSK